IPDARSRGRAHHDPVSGHPAAFAAGAELLTRLGRQRGHPRRGAILPHEIHQARRAVRTRRTDPASRPHHCAGGAGGAIGTKSVANAAPDGATLPIGTSATLGVVPALMKNPGYDPIKSFAPVAKVADSTLVLVVPAAFPAKSGPEFVVYAKANPGKLSFASAGVGNQTQLLAELFKSKAGLDIVHV